MKSRYTQSAGRLARNPYNLRRGADSFGACAVRGTGSPHLVAHGTTLPPVPVLSIRLKRGSAAITQSQSPIIYLLLLLSPKLVVHLAGCDGLRLRLEVGLRFGLRRARLSFPNFEISDPAPCINYERCGHMPKSIFEGCIPRRAGKRKQLVLMSVDAAVRISC